MTANTVDWSTLTRDPAADAAVTALESVASAFDTAVPAVLIPVRIETRFTTVEVSDPTDHVVGLLDLLARIDALLRRLSGREYHTVLLGNVKQKAEVKLQEEQPLYEAIESDLAALGEALAGTRSSLDQPITSATPEQQRRLAALVPAVREGLGTARAALSGLRSDYQREKYLGQFDAHAAAIDALLTLIDRRVRPALRLIAELGLRTGAQAARERGLTPRGRELRPDLPRRREALPVDAGRPGPDPTTTRSPKHRIILDDGTSAQALGAERIVQLDRAELIAAAEAAETIVAGLSARSGAIGADLISAAAGIAVLPGSLKAELLARIDAVAARPGAPRLRAEIETTPSDRPDLDIRVPDRLATTVFALTEQTKTVHQLLVRIYPEALAVDSHEDGLTEAEKTAGSAFWTETAAAGAAEELRKGAWRALCVGRSTRRAAWIARVTAPVEPDEAGPTPGADAAVRIGDAITVLEKRLAELEPGRTPPGERPIRLRPPLPARTLTDRQINAVAKAIEQVRSAVEAADALPARAITTLAPRLETQSATVEALARVFGNVPREWPRSLHELARGVSKIPVEAPPEPTAPEIGTRAGTWTRAASSTVLPDRFAVFTVRAGTAGKVTAGRPIPQDLKLGVDPKGDTFSLDDDGLLVVPDSIRWMTDFDDAVDKGMALRLTITAQEAEEGFDELLVVGLSGGDADDGDTRLTALLDAHHYTGDGLSILPIGTPTNNTEDDRAGFSSTDDPDRAYPIERGAPLISSGSDGSRLATALGIDEDVLAHIEGADGTDASDAEVANRALYPGTIGHALEELTSGLITRDARERLRTFALADVSARGSRPAIRVDDQPYGVLPATALSRFRTDLRDSGSEAAAASERARQQRFDDTVLGLFRQLHADWTAIRRGESGGPSVKHAYSDEIGAEGFNAQQHFLAMLGLESSSVGSSYRFSVNVADRTGVRGEPQLGLSFGIPPENGAAATAAADFGPFALLEHLQDVLRTAFAIPAGSDTRLDGVVSEDWEDVLERLSTSRAYGLRLLNGVWPLEGVVSVAPAGPTQGTGSWILTLLGLSLADLRARTENDELSNVGLAEMLVRHALLAEARRAAADLLVARNVMTEESLANLGTSSLFQTWSDGTPSQTSAWGLLFARVDDLAALSGTSAVPADLNGRLMADVLASPRPAQVVEHRGAVTAFAGMPSERMTTLVREHLDLCSYRLDAWIGGLAERRLRTMRDRRRRGAQVGAYGWVENVRPAAAAPAATGVPPALAGLPGRTLMTDASGEGFIQTPSPTHAVTAAILRAAFTSQTTEGSFGNEMSVNLSSSRVRTALGLIDGVRAGNDLGALLGYRLERFLHEYYARTDTPTVVELDSTIFPLREAFPTVAAVDPSVAAVAEPTRYVVDGLALVRAVLDWVEEHDPDAEGTLFDTLQAHKSAHPWGLPEGALPDRLDIAKLDGVLRGIDSIADALDALGDLTTSETVHQLVRGNHARAAAVLAALAEGKAIPHPEITDTPRTGLPVSHRLILQLPPVPAEPVTAPAGWEAIPVTPRAALEPAVNHWLGALIGDPAAIRIRLASEQLPTGAALPEVSIAGLGLQPLDLVALLANGFDSAVGALTARVLDELQPTDLPPDQPGVPTSDGPQTTSTDTWRIESLRAAAWGPGIRSITDVAPLLEAVADLLGTAKPAVASDYAAPESTATAGDGIDAADLETRVQRLLDTAREDAVALARVLAEDDAIDASVLDEVPAVWLGGIRARVPADPAAEHPSAWLPTLDFTSGSSADVTARLARLDGFWSGREAWRTAAKAAQAYGIRVGLPRRFLSRIQVSTELLQSTEVAFLDLAERCRAAAATLAAASDPKPAGAWTQAAKDLLGDDIVLAPRVGLDPVRTDLQTALDADLVDAAEIDAWLEGAAAVRPGAADLADVQLLTEVMGGRPLSASIAQLPPDDTPWLGGPVTDPTGMTGKVSLAIYGVSMLPAAGATGTALLVDQWSESIPYREEVTGVAVHYDQPDATAPQVVLVAVPPVLDQPWTLIDFAATLHDTLEIARNRMVEVEHIGASRYGQLLPLLVGEVVPHAVGSADAGDRVILDFHQNNP
ncbi:hypothetical protein ABZ477_17680 [Microbacterium sp. NPDC019599]|uniref:hypothetical protein n=1 Tax=Microbacterium sp. NPDC019599 TaxID=3154690 RepID=UPI0033CD6750